MQRISIGTWDGTLVGTYPLEHFGEGAWSVAVASRFPWPPPTPSPVIVLLRGVAMRGEGVVLRHRREDAPIGSDPRWVHHWALDISWTSPPAVGPRLEPFGTP